MPFVVALSQPARSSPLSDRLERVAGDVFSHHTEVLKRLLSELEKNELYTLEDVRLVHNEPDLKAVKEAIGNAVAGSLAIRKVLMKRFFEAVCNNLAEDQRKSQNTLVFHDNAQRLAAVGAHLTRSRAGRRDQEART